MRSPVAALRAFAALSTIALTIALCATPAGAGTVCDPVNPQNCIKPTTAGGIPLSPQAAVGGGATALAGTQTNVSLASATALTIPTGATIATISVEGTPGTTGVCARWRDDGTNPTASTGHPLAPLDRFNYAVLTLPIKLITATGATCTMSASYYK